MKTICCVALLLSGAVHAGELMPMSGEESDDMQEAIDTYLLPAVTAAPDNVVVEPILESIDIAGRSKRILFGPFAGGSNVVLRLRISIGDQTMTEVFHAEGGAWKGTFRPGRDYEMLQSVAEQAAELVTAYSQDERTSHRAD